MVVLLCTSHADAASKKKYYRSNKGSLPARVYYGEKTFVFNPATLSWAAYNSSGYKIASGAANGGASYCPDIGRRCSTPVGTYRVQSKGSVSCKSTRYPIKRVRGKVVRGGAPMPYCTYFSTSFAIHGSPYIGGRNQSHGCIRVTTSSARWLSRNFLDVGTKVVVKPY